MAFNRLKEHYNDRITWDSSEDIIEHASDQTIYYFAKLVSTLYINTKYFSNNARYKKSVGQYLSESIRECLLEFEPFITRTTTKNDRQMVYGNYGKAASVLTESEWIKDQAWRVVPDNITNTNIDALKTLYQGGNGKPLIDNDVPLLEGFLQQTDVLLESYWLFDAAWSFAGLVGFTDQTQILELPIGFNHHIEPDFTKKYSETNLWILMTRTGTSLNQNFYLKPIIESHFIDAFETLDTKYN